MANTDWAERRRRMVKCKIHGLHYDPKMSTGCTRCLRESAKAAEPKRSPQLVLILLCILGMVAILFYVLGPGRSETDVIDLGVASQATEIQKLDPGPYRETVESFENALFRSAIDEADDLLIAGADIRASSAELSSTILQRDPAVGLTVADLIARLGQRIPADQVAMSDVQRARTQWLSIRRQYLQPADWLFQPSDAEEDAEAAAIAAYSHAASSLQTLIDDGIGEIQSLSEPAEGDGDDDTEAAWRELSRGWRQQLLDLERRLPKRPGTGADNRLLVAIQNLEQALGQARGLASAASPPDPADSRFQEASDAALRARQAFDELQL